MKLNKTLLLLLPLLVLGGCSNKPKRKPDYVITQSSHDKEPAWINDISKANSGKNSKDFKYYKSDFEHVSKSLCRKGANANANSIIASEIAQFVEDTYKEVNTDKNASVDNYIQNNLTRTISAGISGVETAESYYEERNHLEKLGAPEEGKTYYCASLVRIKKDLLEKLISASTKGIVDRLSNPQQKEAVKEAMETATKELIAENE